MGDVASIKDGDMDYLVGSMLSFSRMCQPDHGKYCIIYRWRYDMDY